MKKKAIFHTEICVQERSKQRTACNMVGGNTTDPVNNLESKQGYDIAKEPAEFSLHLCCVTAGKH